MAVLKVTSTREFISVVLLGDRREFTLVKLRVTRRNVYETEGIRFYVNLCDRTTRLAEGQTTRTRL